MEDLPTEYDEIILGTGLQESVLAAGLARIGRAVLHLDRNEFYGGDWATFNLNGLATWIESNQDASDDNEVMSVDADSLEDGERIVYLPKHGHTISNIDVEWFVSEGEPVPERRGRFNRQPTPPPPQVEADLPGDDASPEVNDQPQPDLPTNQEGAILPEDPATQGPETADQSATSGNAQVPPDGHQEDSSLVSLPPNADVASRSADSTGDVNHQNNELNTEDAPVEEAVAEEAMADAIPEDAPTEETLADGAVADAAPVEPMAEVVPEEPPVEEPVAESANAEEAKKQWTQNLVKHEWRKFNIDLSPKLMFCRGSLIEALIESRVSRYAEFKAITRTLTYINGKIEKVPCSRSDVFSSKYVTMLEKRILMKFIEFSLHYQERQIEYEEYLDKPFVEFLKFKKLTKTLQHFVMHSIAMVTEDTLTEEGLKSMHHFLKSLGRYGNTAFLWTLYGSGELPQCFCRMCAVFNGIYMLRCPGKGLIVDAENKCKGIISADGRRLLCKNVIMDHSYRPSVASAATTLLVSRAVLMIDRSIWPTDQEEISLLTVPPLEGSPQPIQVVELPYGTYACPKDIFLVHMTCRSHGSTAKEDFQEARKLLFQPTNTEDDPESSKPRVIWSMYFNMVDMTGVEDDDLRDGLPGNTEVTSGPGCSIGYEHAVEQAKKIFEKLCPGEDFLPAVPDPDDIIIENQSHDNPGHKPGFEDNTTDETGNVETKDENQVQEKKSQGNNDICGEKEAQETTPDGSGEKEAQETTPDGSGEKEAQETTPDGSGEKEAQETAPDGSGEKEAHETTPDGSGEKEAQETTPDGSGEKEAQETIPDGSGEKEAQETTPDGSGEKEAQETTPDGSGEKEAHETTPDGSGEKEAHETTPDGSGEKEAQETTPDGSGEKEAQETTPDGSGEKTSEEQVEEKTEKETTEKVKAEEKNKNNPDNLDAIESIDNQNRQTINTDKNS